MYADRVDGFVHTADIHNSSDHYLHLSCTRTIGNMCNPKIRNHGDIVLIRLNDLGLCPPHSAIGGPKLRHSPAATPNAERGQLICNSSDVLFFCIYAVHVTESLTYWVVLAQ